MTEVATVEPVNEALLPAIPPRLQAAGITMRDDKGYRTLGIPPALRETYNIIFPTVELTQQNPDFWPTIREIKLSAAGDTYAGASHHKANECSLNKTGLYKLAEAAKIDLTTERIPADHLGPTERCGWRAHARQRHSDGTQTLFTSSSTFDNEAERLQIEAQGSKDTVEKRWATKIQKASELCETIAIERAIRGMLKLPHKHTKADIEKPFLVVCYSFIPMSAEGKAAAAAGMSRLFGGDGPAGALPASTASDLPAIAAPQAAEQPAAAPATEEEPLIETQEDEDAGEGEYEHPAEPSEELVALAEAAKEVRPPYGSYQEKTLGWILEQRPGSDKWLRAEARKTWTGADADYGRHLLALMQVHAPELLLEPEATS